jgi:hypothetical protein
MFERQFIATRIFAEQKDGEYKKGKKGRKKNCKIGA